MTPTIYRYTLDPANPLIDMPMGATILHVDWWKDAICLWAKVDADLPVEQRRFAVVGTGHELPVEMHRVDHLGTLLIPHHALVLHVFEDRR